MPGVKPLGQDANGIFSYFGYDGLGSVRTLFSAGGMQQSLTNFDPYGQVLEQTGGVNSQLGFTGALTDESGFDYLNARTYDPAIGEFLSVDPVQGKPDNPQSFNSYDYVQDNPVNATDPSGKCWQFVPFILAPEDGFVTAPFAIAGLGVCLVAVDIGLQAADQGVDTFVAATSAPHQSSSSTTTTSTSTGAVASGGPICFPGDTTCETNNNDTCSSSFSADTLVETDQGEKPIDEVKVGDKVLAYNVQTGKDEYDTVDAVITHTDPATVNLTISGEVIHTTPEHPFFTQDRGFVAASDLRVGESARKADGSYGIVQSIVEIAQSQVMYDLTVHGAHTFFVGGGQWLVHNAPYCYKVTGSDPFGVGDSPQLQRIFSERRDFITWVRKFSNNTGANPLTYDQAQQLLDAIVKLNRANGLPDLQGVDLNEDGLNGMELRNPWPHFKIGQWHIPVKLGWVPTIPSP